MNSKVAQLLRPPPSCICSAHYLSTWKLRIPQDCRNVACLVAVVVVVVASAAAATSSAAATISCCSVDSLWLGQCILSHTQHNHRNCHRSAWLAGCYLPGCFISFFFVIVCVFVYVFLPPPPYLSLSLFLPLSICHCLSVFVCLSVSPFTLSMKSCLCVTLHLILNHLALYLNFILHYLGIGSKQTAFKCCRKPYTDAAVKAVTLTHTHKHITTPIYTHSENTWCNV